MKIFLPNSAFLGNIDPFIKGYDASMPDRLEIISNKKWISLHPMALSMVGALGSTVPPSAITYEPFEARSRHYLERMGLFRLLGIGTDIKITAHEPAGRFIPLTVITNSHELSVFITDMVPMLHVEPHQSEPIRYIVSELVRNVLEHASSKNGAVVCAQFYRKSNIIRIGIADTGIGIKETISRSYDAPTHLEALRMALTPGITGATRMDGGTEQNAGAGLFFIRSIANVNRDFFVLYSGDSMYKLLKHSARTKRIKLHADPFGDRHSTEEKLPFWRGTVVGIDISLDATGEFSDLLDQVRKIYVDTVRERRKAKYRRPRFT